MSASSPALVIGLIAIVGFLCQWLAWRVKLPAILFLLLAGILLGPGLDIVNPDVLLGDLLFTVVALSVAIILFEGSLTLEFSEIKDLSKIVQRLVTVGALLTWVLSAIVSHALFDFDWPMAFLLGSLIVVTGPTVIIPMLRTVRPNRRIGNVLRWEGIVIDPIGALFAVVVYEYIVAGAGNALGSSVEAFFKICIIGTLLGLASGFSLGFLLRNRWLPEYLHNFGTIALVLGVFTLSNHLEHESGLLAVTVMGISLANMRGVHVEEILSFKENLTVLLISALFILLAARIDLVELAALGWPAFLLLMALQFVIRPLSVFLSGIGSDLNWREKALIAWIGPRGIVAAAVSGLFALQLEQQGYENAAQLASLTFVIIIGTVILQSATAGMLARLLGVVDPEPKGALIIGANHVARSIGEALQKNGFTVLLADASWENIRESRLLGLPTFYGNPISEHADRNLDLVGIGRLVAASPRREENVLASMRYRPEFGRENIFAVQTKTEANLSGKKSSISHEYKGAFIGGEGIDFGKLSQWLKNGASIRTTQLTDNFNFEDLLQNNPGKITPLFGIDKKDHIQMFTQLNQPEPKSGWSIISLYKDDDRNEERAAAASKKQTS